LSLKFWIPTLLIIVVFGVTIPAIVIGDNRQDTGGGGGGGTSAATGGSSSTSSGTTSKGAAGGGNAAALATGKQIFTQSCGTCHTLADAGTNGKVGPVLDQVKPDKALVLSALKNGGLGSGTMPAGLVTGKDAQAVATYVSTVAGK
jgi:cytochrome c553